METCKGCGAEVALTAMRCWACDQLLSAEQIQPTFAEEDLDALADEDNLGPEKGVDADPEVAPPSRAARAHAPVDSLGPLTLELPASAVVAFVAQDEVQAGTISQLLSDCGIQNFASTDESTPSESSPRVHVLKKDLGTALRIIADFTSEFDDGEL